MTFDREGIEEGGRMYFPLLNLLDAAVSSFEVVERC